MTIYIPEKKFLLSLSNEMFNLCKPLHSIGIKSFNYVKIDKNGDRIDINNHAKVSEYFYYDTKNYLNNAIETDPFSIKNKIILYNSYPKDDTWNFLRESCDIDHGIVLVQKNQEYVEMFHFAASKENVGFTNFLLNHLYYMHLFISHFMENGKKLIKKAETNKIKIPLNSSNQQKSEKAILDVFVSLLHFKKVHHPNHQLAQLSKREVECLYLVMKGHSSKSAALELNISHRTFESYVVNIKNKLQVHRKTDLLKKSHELFSFYQNSMRPNAP